MTNDTPTPTEGLEPTPRPATPAEALKIALGRYALQVGLTPERALLSLALTNGLYDPEKLAQLGAPKHIVKGLRSAQRRLHRP